MNEFPVSKALDLRQNGEAMRHAQRKVSHIQPQKTRRPVEHVEDFRLINYGAVWRDARKALRRAGQRLSQPALAKMSGTDPNTVGTFERGQRAPTVTTLMRLSDALHHAYEAAGMDTANLKKCLTIPSPRKTFKGTSQTIGEAGASMVEYPRSTGTSGTTAQHEGEGDSPMANARDLAAEFCRSLAADLGHLPIDTYLRLKIQFQRAVNQELESFLEHRGKG